MGNSKSKRVSPLEAQWRPKNVQTFSINAHKNKIFGCDIIIPDKDRSNEVWVATCSADGKLIIHEVLMETSKQKQDREKILALTAHTNRAVILPENNPYSYSYSPSYSKSISPSKSLSSINWEQIMNHEEIQNILNNSSTKTSRIRKFKTKKRKKLHIEINRLLSLPLDSSICFTLSFHKSCKYVATCIDSSCFIFEIDFTSRSPAYHQIKIANDYLSGAKFIDNSHIILSSGDGNVYIYNFLDELVIATIAAPNNEKRQRNDILCFDHAHLRCLSKFFGNVEKQLIVFATIDGQICVYDVTRIMDDAQFERRIDCRIEATLLQQMDGQFGADINCISISADGKFMIVGAEDNSFNIYSISVSVKKNHRYHHLVRIEWVLVSKHFVGCDQHISRVQWIDDRTCIASDDTSNALYLCGMYAIQKCETVVDVLLDCLLRDNEIDESMDHVMRYIVNIMLEYVKHIVLSYETCVDFDGRISCIATCPEANEGAGMVVVGGFSNVLQGFIPLK